MAVRTRTHPNALKSWRSTHRGTRGSAYLFGLFAPFRPVFFLRSDERMGNLVQDCVADLFSCATCGDVLGESDTRIAKVRLPGAFFGAVEPEVPIAKPVLSHQ